MKKINKWYQGRRIDIHNILRSLIVIIGTTSLITALFIYNNDVVNKILVYAIPFASPIILYFAFTQSRRGNDIKNSLMFYEHECNKIERFVETGQFNRTGDINKFLQLIDLAHYENISFSNSCECFLAIALYFEEEANIIFSP